MRHLACLLFLYSIPMLLGAQESQQTLFDLIATTDDYREITLYTDLTLLETQKYTENYQPATITYALSKKEDMTWHLKIRSRGKYRRRICVIPPIKLNFDKDELDSMGLRKDDEYKLVTHCVEGFEGKDFILKENLTYQLYALLSPLHFRTQLVRITYQDTESSKKVKGWGIIIEDQKTLARRADAKVCDECFGLGKDVFDQQNLTVASLFQYMIGNEDWSLPLHRNIEILEPEEENGTYRIVPYDFDFSGLINASYARPNVDYGLVSVQERVFLGPSTDAELQPAIELFLEKREAMTELIDNYKPLSKPLRYEMIEYLNSFFASLEMSGIRRPAPKD